MEFVDSVCKGFGQFRSGNFSKKTPTTFTIKGKIFLNWDIKTIGEGKKWIFTSLYFHFVKNIVNLELYSETFGITKPSVAFFSEAWISNVNEFQMLHSNNF